MYGNDPKLKAITWERIGTAAATDEESRTLADMIPNSFSEARDNLSPVSWVFWSMCKELYCLEAVTIKANRILIPWQLQAEVLESFCVTYQGVNGILANARQRLVWSSLDASIRQTVTQCCICNTITPSQPREPLMEPKSPFQQVMVDFADIQSKSYLVHWPACRMSRSGLHVIRGS